VNGRVEEDLELGLRSRLKSQSSTGFRRFNTWRHPQFKKYLVYSTVSCTILLILFTVTAFIFYEIMQVYGPPYIYLKGNLTGDAIADLGTVGLITLKPKLGLNVKVTL